MTLSVFLIAVAALQGELTPIEIARRASPAVVIIKTSTPSGGGSASGFIVDPSGTVVTNLHVIQDATAIAVKLANGDIYDHVRIRAFDARKDLAVIQIPGFGLPTVEIGDSDSVKAGQPVVLIGNPLGVLEGSVSTGVVSGVRVLEQAGFRVIQTDAAANPGNSGGPLLDSSGKVIGVLSFKLRGSEGLNFVIPANYARGLLVSTESFDIAELAKRLSGASTDLFSGGTPQFPARWKSLSSGTTKIIRVDGDHVYVETVVSEEHKRLQAFNLAELTKTGDKYVGQVRSGGTCFYNKWNVQKQNFCRAQYPIEIRVLTPTRIEGSAMEFPPSSKFDCEKCELKGKEGGKMTSFVWIPE